MLQIKNRTSRSSTTGGGRALHTFLHRRRRSLTRPQATRPCRAAAVLRSRQDYEAYDPHCTRRQGTVLQRAAYAAWLCLCSLHARIGCSDAPLRCATRQLPTAQTGASLKTLYPVWTGATAHASTHTAPPRLSVKSHFYDTKCPL